MGDRITRVVSLPVRAVLDAETMSPTEAKVIDTFRPVWQMSTDLANWAQRELALRDVRRTPGMDRFPAYDRAAMFGTVARTSSRKAKGDAPAKAVGDEQEGSLYRLFCDHYPVRTAWDGAAVPARDILKAVEDTWRTHKSFGRFAVMWRGVARPAVFRFPYPYPVASDKGKTLRIMRDSENRPVASIPFPGGNRVLVRLADGREFWRQLRQFDWLLANIDRLRQGKVTGRRAGGRLVGADMRLIGAFDAAEKVSGVCARVETGTDFALRATIDGDDGNPFVLYADQLRGVMHCYDRWRHRLARDLKHEKRWPAQKRLRTTGGATAQARMDRMAGRIKSERQQMAVCVVGWLARHGVADVEYVDSEAGYFDWADSTGQTHRRFDLTALREAVRCKCEDAGISFQHHAGGDDGDE